MALGWQSWLHVVILFVVTEHRLVTADGCDSELPDLSGSVAEDCSRRHGAVCSYSCVKGHTKNPSVFWLSCNHSRWENLYYSEYSRNKFSACIHNDCNPQIPNGHLAPECIPTDGYLCRYTCSAGFRPTDNRPMIQCNKGSSWSENDEPLCLDIRCPAVVPNGVTDANCSRIPDRRCNFTCNIGYEQQRDVDEPYCILLDPWMPGQWDSSAECICSTAKKPFGFKGGIPGAIGILAAIVFISSFLQIHLARRRRRQMRQLYDRRPSDSALGESSTVTVVSADDYVTYPELCTEEFGALSQPQTPPPYEEVCAESSSPPAYTESPPPYEADDEFTTNGGHGVRKSTC